MLGKVSAIFLLIILSPLFMVISILILIFSGRPIIFRQKRCGFQYKEFEIIKFRTMHPNNGYELTEYKDERITKIGRFLRKFKLDELPQLINIIEGNMGFIGPRPEAIKIVNNNREYFTYLNTIKPGVTDVNSIIFKDESIIFKNLNIKIYEKEILPIKSRLSSLTVIKQNIINKIILIIFSIISVINHNLSLHLVRYFFLPNLELDFRIKLNKLLSKQIF
ncbi:MAG: sugar transferase [Candidatus Marinimicrobia bacterium]|nr:sugar transferase [Candidatus Neomarinimicrobiota bacterium]